MELKQDLYIIPLSNGNLIYSPLRRSVFWANDEASQTVKSYLAGNKNILTQVKSPVIKHIIKLENATETTPLHYTEYSNKSHLVVIPSQICNLACTYCYAYQAHTKDSIDKSILVKAYDYILKSNSQNKYFSFIGGGEPLMAWDILNWSFEYISTHKSQTDNTFFNVTTNATSLNEDIILIIKKYGIHINVSFDILKKVQDVQRPFQNNSRSSFDIIHKNILMIDKCNIPYSIRSTITMKNVSLMPEMVKFVIDNYHNLKSLHFEPVTENYKNNSEYYDKYINSFFQARKIAKRHGLDLYNSITRSVFNIKAGFCNGELCLTPTGHIVACHRISSIKDKYFNLFCYGKITDSGIEISQNKYQEFLRFSHAKKSEDCKKCFAYWHCAGICPMERISLTENQLMGKCVFTREIIKRTLLEFIEK